MSQAAFASDTALIVQGLLIFSAAVVGVIGYYVQSKLAAKARQRELLIARQEHLRQLELSRIREKLDTFIGPVSFLQHSFSGQLLGTVQVRMGEFFPQEHAQHKALFKEKGGWPAAFQGKAKFALMDGIYFGEAGASVSRQLTSAPDSEAAQLYRQVMRRLVLDYAVPLADLIKAYGGHLQEWTTGDEFKRSYPFWAGNPQGRNLFFLEFQSFAYEFRDLVTTQWDTGNFARAWPFFTHYHYAMWTYASQMITRIRMKENAYGTASHAVTLAEDDVKLVSKGQGDGASSSTVKRKSSSVDRSSKSDTSSASGHRETSNKYTTVRGT
jgi:hypothetical protein